jgi:hypothetical protein
VKTELITIRHIETFFALRATLFKAVVIATHAAADSELTSRERRDLERAKSYAHHALTLAGEVRTSYDRRRAPLFEIKEPPVQGRWMRIRSWFARATQLIEREESRDPNRGACENAAGDRGRAFAVAVIASVITSAMLGIGWVAFEVTR